MAIVVYSLVLTRALGQAEDAPVVDAADDAAGAENLGAGCACDSVGEGVSLHVQDYLWD